MFLSLPAHTFHTRAVASVSDLSGAGAGVGTLISACLATLLFVTLVRARKRPDPDGLTMRF
ncbi:MAG: hypothetical protein ACRD9L_28705 [Bryobacteraceae bacterium]